MKSSRLAQSVVVVVGIAVIAAVIVGAVVWFTPLTSIKNVEVNGVVHANAEELQKASGIEAGQNLAKLDSAGAAKKVAEQPWVRRATVSRSWPSTAKIDITEYSSVLFMRATDGDHLFDAEGNEFLTAPAPEGTVELVEAPRVDQPTNGKIDPEPEALNAALKTAAALSEQLRAEVAQIKAPSATEISLKMKNGKAFFIGSTDNLQQKVRAVELLKDREENNWNLSNPLQPTVQE